MSDMLLDAAHVAAGGVYVAAVMGTTLGPSLFVTGFNAIGIHVVGGHEVSLVDESWQKRKTFKYIRVADANSA